jgi:phosphoribosylformylglycinamidine synthase
VTRPEDSDMLCLRGAPAFSGFRLAKLEQRLRETGLTDARLSARLMHFAQLERSLEPQEQALLERLLTYGPSGDTAEQPDGRLIWWCRGPAPSRPGRRRPRTSPTTAG